MHAQVKTQQPLHHQQKVQALHPQDLGLTLSALMQQSWPVSDNSSKHCKCLKAVHTIDSVLAACLSCSCILAKYKALSNAEQHESSLLFSQLL